MGKLACLVLSKILGIGTAKQNWKQVKFIRSGLRSHTDTDRVKKQAALYGQYQQVKARAKQTKQRFAGKLWEENDFKSIKMDEYCKDVWQSLDGADKRPIRVFRNWQETWEKKKLGPTGNVMLHEKLKVKYVGLKLDMNEGYHRIFTVHEVQFVRETRRKYYRIVAVLKEFDTAMSVDNNDEDHYDFGDFCPETYNCFRASYDLHAKEDNTMVFEKGGACDSNFKKENVDLA